MKRILAGAAAALCAAAPLAVSAQTASAPAAAPVQAALMAPGLRVTDLDRSLRFYAIALGLVPALTLKHGPVTEVMLAADSKAGKMGVILLHDETPGKSLPIDLGNGFSKIVMRVPDLGGVVARMKAAGYAVGDIRVSKERPSVLFVKDPDGYSYELVGTSPPHA